MEETPNDSAEVDGGYPAPIMENRERLVRVERSQKQILNTIDRVEDKVEETQDLIERVDDMKLSQQTFNNQYADVIDQWGEYIVVAKWAGAMLVVFAAVAQLALMVYGA